MYYIVEVEDRHVNQVQAYHSLEAAENAFKDMLDNVDGELEVEKSEILKSLALFIEGTDDFVEIPYISKYGNEVTIALTV